MSLARSGWQGRRKPLRRRAANDLRTAAPLIAFALCLAGSAAAIAYVEAVSAPSEASARSLPPVGAGGAGPDCPIPSETPDTRAFVSETAD